MSSLSPKQIKRNRAAAEAAVAERETAKIAEQVLIAHCRALIEDSERTKEQMRVCYREYAPVQLQYGGPMVRAHETALKIARCDELSKAGLTTYERVGRSNGGRRRGNLYVCNLAVGQ